GDPLVDMAFAIHVLGDPGLAHEVHETMLQHTCTDPAQDVLRSTRFQDDIVDPLLVQELAQQQAGGTGAYDCNLSFQDMDSVSRSRCRCPDVCCVATVFHLPPTARLFECTFDS